MPILIYWLMGCFLIGTSVGSIRKECPSFDSPSAGEYIVQVAAWPAMLIAAYMSPRPHKCEGEKSNG